MNQIIDICCKTNGFSYMFGIVPSKINVFPMEFQYLSTYQIWSRDGAKPPPPPVVVWASKINGFPIEFQYFSTYQLWSPDVAPRAVLPCDAVAFGNRCFSYGIS